MVWDHLDHIMHMIEGFWRTSCHGQHCVVSSSTHRTSGTVSDGINGKYLLLKMLGHLDTAIAYINANVLLEQRY